MSFSSEVKKEILMQELSKSKCCRKAAAYAIVCFAKQLNTVKFTLSSDNFELLKYAQKILLNSDIKGEIQTVKHLNREKSEFVVDDLAQINKMMQTFLYTGQETTTRINSGNFGCNNCVNAFLATVFLICGTMTNPGKEYNLEFTSNKYNLIKDLSALLTANGFNARHTVRKGLNVLYIKSSEQIEDLLTFMGATNSALEIMNLKVYKDIRNKANRITNCETANIDKIVAANESVLSAIKLLRKNGAYNLLADELKQTADLREELPSLSLNELAERFNPPISKSGLSHRLKKIVKIANQSEVNANNEQ